MQKPSIPAFDSHEFLARVGPGKIVTHIIMNKFRKLGLISYNGTIEVHRSLINAVLRDKVEINKQDELDGFDR